MDQLIIDIAFSILAPDLMKVIEVLRASNDEACQAYADEMEKQLDAVLESADEKIFDCEALFNRYTKVPELKEVDILHLYDTGEGCYKDNSGYHDSRHFNLVGFNTETMERADFGRHDGIAPLIADAEVTIRSIRVFADGSFLVQLSRPYKIYNSQNVGLY